MMGGKMESISLTQQKSVLSPLPHPIGVKQIFCFGLNAFYPLSEKDKFTNFCLTHTEPLITEVFSAKDKWAANLAVFIGLSRESFSDYAQHFQHGVTHITFYPPPQDNLMF